MKILESAEDYLEMILVIKRKKGVVRSIDIAHEMNFSKPSVSIAMKKLRESGFIRMDINGLITLTDQGREVAERIYSRHKLLTKVLEAIGAAYFTTQFFRNLCINDLQLFVEYIHDVLRIA